MSAIRLFLPLSVGASMLIVAWLEEDPQAAAETAYLSVLATGVLLATAQVQRRIGTAFGFLAVLVASTVWALPGTPDRSAALCALLVAGLTAAGLSRQRTEGPSRRSATVGLFLAGQLLFRSQEILEASLLESLDLLGWAVLAALATMVLETVWGRPSAAVAAIVAALLGSGFEATNALGLACLACSHFVFDPGRSRLARSGAAAFFILPMALDLGSGSLLVLCGLVGGGPVILRIAAPALALLIGWSARALGPMAALRAMAIVPILLPVPILEAARGRVLGLAALAIGFAAALTSNHTVALATPAALLALSTLGKRDSPSSLQPSWAGALLVGSLLLASPPWLRPRPLEGTLDLLGLAPGWLAAILVLAAFGSLLLYARLLDKKLSARWPSPQSLAGVVVAVALLASIPIDSRLLIDRRPVVLDRHSSTWVRKLQEPTTVRAIVIDSFCANSISAPNGTAFALLRLRVNGEIVELPIRVGIESGEWAAARTDVRQIPGFVAPPAFLSWVDASGTFFGQRYRAVWRFPHPLEVEEIEVRIAADAPENAAITLFRLEIRG